MKIKEAVGKTVKRIEVLRDLDQADVEIEFTDGTFLHIGMNPTVDVKTNFQNEKEEYLFTRTA